MIWNERIGHQWPDGIEELIRICWQTNPSQRPDFPQIVEFLTKIQENVKNRRNVPIPGLESTFSFGLSSMS